MAFLYPKEWNKQAVIWIDDVGKSVLFADDGKLKPQVQRLVASGVAVIGVDLFLQGEFLSDDQKVDRNREVANNREFAGYTYGYNPSLLAQRVHDVMTVVVFCSNHQLKPEKLDLIGLTPQAGPIVVAARAQSADLVRRIAVDTHGFRFGKLLDYRDPMFLPGGAKYGDLPALIALSAPQQAWVAGEGEGSELPKQAFTAAKANDKLVWDKGDDATKLDRAVEWLVK